VIIGRRIPLSLDKQLPSITIGRTRRITRRALEDFVESRAAEQCGYMPHRIALHYADEQ
jgi:hypothetical protein